MSGKYGEFSSTVVSKKITEAEFNAEFLKLKMKVDKKRGENRRQSQYYKLLTSIAPGCGLRSVFDSDTDYGHARQTLGRLNRKVALDAKARGIENWKEFTYVCDKTTKTILVLRNKKEEKANGMAV